MVEFRKCVSEAKPLAKPSVEVSPHKKMKKFIQIALTLTLTFAFSNLGLLNAKEGGLKLDIPEKYGRVVESYQGKDNRLIVQIQDLHTNYEAQANEAKLIYHLLKNKGWRLVATEGAEGEVDTSIFELFDDTATKEEVARFFMSKGQITGAEYLHILKKIPFTIYGAEDTDLYRKHLNSFNNSLSYKDDVLQYCRQVKDALNEIKSHIYAPELKELDRKISAYDERKLSLNKYVGYLNRIFFRYSVNLKRFPNFERLGGIIELEEEIDFKKVEKEHLNAIKELSQGLSEKELADLIVKSVDFKAEKISAGKYYGHLRKLIAGKSFSLRTYPNLERYIYYIIISEQINHRRLFSEIKDLEKVAKETLYTNSGQARLDRLLKNIDILEGFINIKLTNEDVGYYYSHKSEFTPQIFRSFIQKYASQYNLNNPFYNFSTCLPEMENFYTLADQRDKILIENTLKAMQVKGEKAAILICGGFHTRGITELLKQKEISYIIITPKVGSKMDTELYFSVLKGEMVSDEEMEELEKKLAKEKK